MTPLDWLILYALAVSLVVLIRNLVLQLELPRAACLPIGLPGALLKAL